MSELITMTEAGQRLGVSRNTLRQRIREAGITTYENPRDKRARLVDWHEIEAAFRPRIRVMEGKVAA
jgi:predicted site-specific integrase-resolvase